MQVAVRPVSAITSSNELFALPVSFQVGLGLLRGASWRPFLAVRPESDPPFGRHSMSRVIVRQVPGSEPAAFLLVGQDGTTTPAPVVVPSPRGYPVPGAGN